MSATPQPTAVRDATAHAKHDLLSRRAAWLKAAALEWASAALASIVRSSTAADVPILASASFPQTSLAISATALARVTDWIARHPSELRKCKTHAAAISAVAQCWPYDDVAVRQLAARMEQEALDGERLTPPHGGDAEEPATHVTIEAHVTIPAAACEVLCRRSGVAGAGSALQTARQQLQRALASASVPPSSAGGDALPPALPPRAPLFAATRVKLTVHDGAHRRLKARAGATPSQGQSRQAKLQSGVLSARARITPPPHAPSADPLDANALSVARAALQRALDETVTCACAPVAAGLGAHMIGREGHLVRGLELALRKRSIADAGVETAFDSLVVVTGCRVVGGGATERLQVALFAPFLSRRRRLELVAEQITAAFKAARERQKAPGALQRAQLEAETAEAMQERTLDQVACKEERARKRCVDRRLSGKKRAQKRALQGRTRSGRHEKPPRRCQEARRWGAFCVQDDAAALDE